MAQAITLSSVGTAAMILNPVAKSTTVVLTVPSSGTVSIELTLDDPTIPGGPSLVWGLLSSGSQMASSSVTGGSLVYTILSPIGGVRLNSAAVIAGGTFTLRALQSVSA